MLRLMVVGEGPHELGDVETWERDTAPKAAALPTLVHRLLCEPSGVTYHKVQLDTKQTRQEKRYTRKHLHGVRKGFHKRAKLWIERAFRAKCHAVVVICDRDGDENTDRLEQMKAGRDEMAADTEAGYPPCAVGVAVESFDAWMIADGAAVGQAGGDGANSHPQPEGLKAGVPKDRARTLFGDEEGLRACYATVAEHVNLETLSKCCPVGFAPFKEEIQQRIRPLLQEN